ncbi:hypothetical protein CPAR01_16131 [Colletotrichum paranaense]|uniref:Uncharacterized protein n=1 Tax=Colletotrichum paranaense TaxID=1914294 RepID=A0ABQ9RXL7_9PEZI|nr:uncharacterized protein CPAR01_16131 [Colletotrichum paranaense]KAK1517267.1 hypothetical protein CPAR01_16131 [Colletotrichum paranaense]
MWSQEGERDRGFDGRIEGKDAHLRISHVDLARWWADGLWISCLHPSMWIFALFLVELGELVVHEAALIFPFADLSSTFWLLGAIPFVIRSLYGVPRCCSPQVSVRDESK